MTTATNFMFNQMHAQKGIKCFGERAIAALVKEFKQLDTGVLPGKSNLGPIDPNILNLEEK